MAPLRTGQRSLARDIRCIHACGADRILISVHKQGCAEALARRIHNRGRSPIGPFDTVDCGAPDAVLENSLFGRLTPLRAEPGGTLFLREVGKLGPGHQARLLKALTECAAASWPEPMTPRAIAFTSEPLFERVHGGTFDLQLFYRLNVIHIDLRQQWKPDGSARGKIFSSVQKKRPRN
jgi:transcriptional regulator of acetoin/glycerol metabolism